MRKATNSETIKKPKCEEKQGRKEKMEGRNQMEGMKKACDRKHNQNDDNGRRRRYTTI